MPSNELKRAARAYAAKHGVKYTEALRAVSAGPERPADRVRALVTVTANSDGTVSPRRWEIVVDDPRTEKPFAEWVYGAERFGTRVDELADVHGWRRAPGAEWPVEPTSDPVVVELERSEVGQRNDEVETILAAAGVTWHEACEPYMAAVAHELERAGIGVKEAFAAGNEPRDGAVDLSTPLSDHNVQLAWREDQGWYYLSFPRGETADGVIDLPVGHLAEPYDVATAFCKAIDHPVRSERPDWRPPADYDLDAVAPDESWDVSPALERALTCYTTYPGWTPAAPAPTPTPEPVHTPRDSFDPTAYDVIIVDPVTGCWRAWSHAEDTVVRPEPELADDGEWIYDDVRIADELFPNYDGELAIGTGRADVTPWLANRPAPTGSQHDNSDDCRVCNDFHNYEIPTTLQTLEHRGHQIRAAYERLRVLAPGAGARVLAERDGDVLVLTLRLIDPATRMLGLHWRSDSHDWKAIVQTDGAPGEEHQVGTLLDRADWQPYKVAVTMERYAGYHR
ncbi:DUF6292 family protein [Amycolatopsis sp. TNS106]|uniref:DUF6292 family protein n=1 Tax=Amycolatopsis sp. TNS106 TaxID=2861750 RepID=UPI001C59B8AB|nr:DUF6292 family protein [Amycolatopsis sp. TNS106]QXV63548.1 hypothetical protein CVV72_41030 [Amycolatopsis sp. TNS106]